ncbi:TPA: hypothetical protein ACH3X1_005396 [Trebouxia sp. C0004]
MYRHFSVPLAVIALLKIRRVCEKQYMPLHTKSCSTEGNLVPEAVDEQDNAWYPMAVVEDLDESKPIPVKLFGKSLVLWHDAAVQWKCLAETCPHRSHVGSALHTQQD